MKDVRICGLINVEQKRLDRLQAVIDCDTPSTQKNALAFLGTLLGNAAVASRLAMMASPAESEVEAKREVARRFVRREQASIRHNFNAVSPPPPLRCPRSDCDATFVDRGHCLRHAADVHPTDEPEVAELSSAMRDPASLAVFEKFIEDAAAAADFNENDILLQVMVRPDRHEEEEEAGGGQEAKENDQGTATTTTAAGDGRDGVAAARDTLDLWKAIEEWRAVPTSSSSSSSSQQDDLYRRLSTSILERFVSSGTTTAISRNDNNTKGNKKPHLPGNVRIALGGEQLHRVFGKLGTTYHSSNSSNSSGNKFSMKKLLGGVRHHHSEEEPEQRPSLSSSSSPSNKKGGGDDQVQHLGNIDVVVDPSALEEASFQAVVFLSESAIGRAFLRSAPYERYLHGLQQPMKDAARAQAAEFAADELEAWAAEGRRLRRAALGRRQEFLIDSLADQAVNVVFEGDSGAASGAGLVGGLVDDQVTNALTRTPPAPCMKNERKTETGGAVVPPWYFLGATPRCLCRQNKIPASTISCMRL